MGKLIVTKGNKLIEGKYKLSLNEQRLVLLAIAKIDSRKAFKSNKFVITASEFSEQFDVPLKQAYEAMNDAADRLYDRDIRTADTVANTTTRTRWVSSVTYSPGQGVVEICFSQEVKPYLTMLAKNFTSYELKQIAHLNTAYAIRLYELLVQFSKTGERFINLLKFREMLVLEDKYPLFADFRRRVIDPAVMEINATTNIRVEYELKRTARQVTGLVFSFVPAEQHKLEL